MQAKTKLAVALGSSLAAVGSMFIVGVSQDEINRTKVHEGYSSTVYADAGKVYTQGFGSTVKPNGKPITKYDAPIDRKTATVYLQHHYDVRVTPHLNKSLQGIKISQIEYDVAANFIYQYGAGAWLRSTMLTELKSGNYVASCKAYLRYALIKRRNKQGVIIETINCRTDKRCRGVFKRSNERYERCMGANT